MRYHCLFEQSGTFKNVLKEMGYEAYDYDILNDFNETDYQIDLFAEEERKMTKVKIITFKHNRFWYACCELPEEASEIFYCDNKPYISPYVSHILHERGLNRDQTVKKLIDKIERINECTTNSEKNT